MQLNTMSIAALKQSPFSPCPKGKVSIFKDTKVSEELVEP